MFFVDYILEKGDELLDGVLLAADLKQFMFCLLQVTFLQQVEYLVVCLLTYIP
jgi:hypothetical protein